MICVGNLTAGGTGKTPMVAAIVKRLLERGRRPAILSRGWGGDEAILYGDWLDEVPHVIDSNRVRGASRALEEEGADCLVLDDGFQHWRLVRDLDVVLVDSTDPFGGGSLIPRGLLREPLSALMRAGVVVLTRADHLDECSRRMITRRIARWTRAHIAEAVHQPIDLVPTPGGGVLPLEVLRHEPVHGFCGIGRPEAFRATLESLGARVVRFDALPDHHAYREEELTDLLVKGQEAGARFSVTTEKDAVKLRHLSGRDRSFLTLRIRMNITRGDESLDQVLERALEGRSSCSR